jgi:hypothetical protein
MGDIDRERLRELVAESGRSARSISLAAKLGATAIKDILSGKSRDPGGATISAIASELGVAMGEFYRDGVPADDARHVQIVPRFLPVRFRVRAGLWEEVGSEEPISDFDFAVGPNPRFAEWPQWLEEVKGDSCNELIPDRHLAHVVDAVEMGYEAQTGDVVVVERRRDGGHTRERTIKQVEITADGLIQLWPRSANPKWSEPVAPTNGTREGEEIEVEIVGLVIGSYNPTLLKRR